MNTILLPSGFGDAMRRSTSLASFKDYRQAEAQNPQQLSVTLEGTLLEYETLELRYARQAQATNWYFHVLHSLLQ